MIGYYENPEIKRNLILILILSVITVFVTSCIVNASYESIKKSCINNNAAVLGKIVKSHPELKNEIVPLITKGSDKQDIESGKQVLKDYGYDTNLNVSLIPEVKDNYRDLMKFLSALMLCIFIVIILINNIEYIKIYKKLESLNLAAKNIIDYNFDIKIYENSEGIFAKLAHNFNNMRVVLKNNIFETQSEKDFLINTLSDISHQIKTPISSLILYNDILLNRKLNEEKKVEFLKSSASQLNRIEWLVKSLLQLARMDAGVIKFKIASFDINETVMESVKFLEMKARSNNIKLEFYSDKDKIVIKHDHNWVSEAIINIIKNAIEHTESNGEVNVFTEATQVCSRIIVKDNGKGIPKEEIPHVFERFYKGKMNKSTESIGIGLALSKSIIEGNEGMISVKSELGVGTSFTITFLNSI